VKVFMSSVVGGYDEFRASAAEAIETLGHQVLRSENFPASVGTPQQACLAAVRDADVVVLLLGERYGAPQDSGLSATHEEYREAREKKPILVFVEEGVTSETAQRAFIDEVEAWSTGHVRVGFSTPEDLKAKVTRALHEYELAASAGAVDEDEMLERARAMIPDRSGFGSSPQLVLVIVGGPYQQIVRPSELEDRDLMRDLQMEALFGTHPVLDPSDGTDASIQGTGLTLRQSGSFVTFDQAGTVSVGQRVQKRRPEAGMELPALIVEDAKDALAAAIRFAGLVLDRVDPTHRVTDVVVMAHLAGAGFMPWRTRAEHQASPNAGQMGIGGDDITVTLTPARRRRQALTHEADRIAEDLVTLLRRARSM
jgi:hypothetical protein